MAGGVSGHPGKCHARARGRWLDSRGCAAVFHPHACLASRGLGVVLRVADAQGPADVGGIKAGDRIISVDGKTPADVSSDALADMLRGAEGSQVEVVARLKRTMPEVKDLDVLSESYIKTRYGNKELTEAETERLTAVWQKARVQAIGSETASVPTPAV